LCKVRTCHGKHGAESSAKMSAVNGVVKTNNIQTSGKKYRVTGLVLDRVKYKKLVLFVGCA